MAFPLMVLAAASSAGASGGTEGMARERQTGGVPPDSAGGATPTLHAPIAGPRRMRATASDTASDADAPRMDDPAAAPGTMPEVASPCGAAHGAAGIHAQTPPAGIGGAPAPDALPGQIPSAASPLAVAMPDGSSATGMPAVPSGQTPALATMAGVAVMATPPGGKAVASAAAPIAPASPFPEGPSARQSPARSAEPVGTPPSVVPEVQVLTDPGQTGGSAPMPPALDPAAIAQAEAFPPPTSSAPSGTAAVKAAVPTAAIAAPPSAEVTLVTGGASQERTALPPAPKGTAPAPRLASLHASMPDQPARAAAAVPQAAPAPPQQGGEGAQPNPAGPEFAGIPSAASSEEQPLAALERTGASTTVPAAIAQAETTPPPTAATPPASLPVAPPQAPAAEALPHAAAALRYYPASTPVTAQAAPGILAVAMRAAVNGGGARLSIAIRPAELGRVEIAVERNEDGTARIQVLAERPETLMLLQRDVSLLDQALQQTGLGTAGHSLDLGLSDSGGQAWQDAPGGGQGDRGGHPDRGSSPAALPPVLRPLGLLDLAL